MRTGATGAFSRCNRRLPAPREMSLDGYKKHTQQTGTQRRFMHFPAANTGGVHQRLARRALLTTRTRATTLPPRRTRRRQYNKPARQEKAAEQISPALNDENAPNGAQKGFLKEQTHPPRTKRRQTHYPHYKHCPAAYARALRKASALYRLQRPNNRRPVRRAISQIQITPAG